MESEAFYFINQGHSPNFLFFYIKKKKRQGKNSTKQYRVFRGQGNKAKSVTQDA